MEKEKFRRGLRFQDFTFPSMPKVKNVELLGLSDCFINRVLRMAGSLRDKVEVFASGFRKTEFKCVAN